jgi:apolipoprotein N-acyltransferase
VRWLPFLQWFTPITGGWTSGEKPVTFQLTELNKNSGDLTNVIYLGNSNASLPENSRADAKIGPLICFEDTFATTARDAAQDDLDFLINLTNDGWFGDSSEQWQHMANSVFRCVENGLPLLRSCNIGVTCYVDAHGRVENIFRDATGNEYHAGVMSVKVPLLATTEKSAPPFYNRHGDWFGWSCVGITLILIGRKITR